MRNFIDIVKSGLAESFDPSDYGYWIRPTGEIISCGTITHGEAAAQQLGRHFDVDDEDTSDEIERELVDDGLDEGAVRIVASKGSEEFNAEWNDTSVTREASKALIELLKMYSGRKYFILQSEYIEDFRKALQYARRYTQAR